MVVILWVPHRLGVIRLGVSPVSAVRGRGSMVTGRVVPLAASLFGRSRGAQGSDLLVVQDSHAPGRGSHGAAGRRVRERLHLSRPRTRRRQWLAAGGRRPTGAVDGKGTMKPVGVLALAALIVAVSASTTATPVSGSG